MKHSATAARVIIAGVTFRRNIGYVDSSVIYIRARGPSLRDVYTEVPVSTEAFCGGYTLQKNTFVNNFGCLFTSGGVVKFECVNSGETSTDYMDRITTPVGTTWVSSVYSAGKYISYAAGTAYSVTQNSVTYTFDPFAVTLKQNVYQQNLGSGPAGLVDIRGPSRIIVEQETYTNNGDGALDLIEKYTALVVAPLIFKQKNGDKIKDAFDPKNSAIYSPDKLLNSMLNIERSTSVTINTIDFKENWLIENGCQNDRSLSIRVKDYAGNMVIHNYDINTQIGAGAATHHIKTVRGIDAAQAKSVNEVGHEVPMILFTPSVMIKKADFTDWTAKSVKFVETSNCLASPFPTMFYSFAGQAAGGASVETLNFKGLTTAPSSLFDTISCLGCTQPIFSVGADTLTSTIENVKFLSFNVPLPTPTMYGPLFKFDLYQPYSSPLITPKALITNLQVDTFNAGVDASLRTGRVLEFKYQYIATETIPLVDQVIIKGSTFTKVTGKGDGVLAKADLNKITMMIESTTFNTIKNEALSGYGVIHGINMAQLTLKTVTANGLYNPVSNTDPLGGGRLFYLKQSEPFKLLINTGTNLKCRPAVYSNLPHEDDAKNDLYAEGSLIELENTDLLSTTVFTIEIKNSNFENCYHANQGGAISAKAAIGAKIILDLQTNTFKYNTAIQGGSIYCEQCQIG